MFSWVALIVLIGCTLVCLVPTAIAFWLIPYLKEQVSYKVYKARETIRTIEEEVNKVKKDNEDLDSLLAENPEYIAAEKSKIKWSHIEDFLKYHFDMSGLNRYNWFYQFFMCFPGFIGAIFAIFFVVYTIFGIPIQTFRVNHWDETYTKYMSLEHPTLKECKDAEELNESLDNSVFIHPKYRNEHCKKIDTENLWIKFCNNVAGDVKFKFLEE